MKKPNILLIGIDFQNDFILDNAPLQVPNAQNDAQNFADFVVKNGHLIDDILLSLDSHQQVHIAHPIFWLDQNGQNPNPFTIITHDDVMSGKYRASNKGYQKWAEQYTKSLKDNSKYVLCIWPPHCIVGTGGWSFHSEVSKAVNEWEVKEFARATLIPKGNSPQTEHYSAFKADVEVDSDPTTKPNQTIINALQNFNGKDDQILIGGEALNFCVINTIRDIFDYFGAEYAKKFVILEDCMSSILADPITKSLHDQALDYLKSNGVTFVKSKNWSL